METTFIMLILSIAVIASLATAVTALRECAKMESRLGQVLSQQKTEYDRHVLSQSSINTKVSSRLDGITKRLNFTIDQITAKRWTSQHHQ